MILGKPTACFLKNKAKQPASCRTRNNTIPKVPKPLSLKQQLQQHKRKFGTLK